MDSLFILMTPAPARSRGRAESSSSSRNMEDPCSTFFCCFFTLRRFCSCSRFFSRRASALARSSPPCSDSFFLLLCLSAAIFATLSASLMVSHVHLFSVSCFQLCAMVTFLKPRRLPLAPNPLAYIEPPSSSHASPSSSSEEASGSFCDMVSSISWKMAWRRLEYSAAAFLSSFASVRSDVMSSSRRASASALRLPTTVDKLSCRRWSYACTKLADWFHGVRHKSSCTHSAPCRMSESILVSLVISVTAAVTSSPRCKVLTPMLRRRMWPACRLSCRHTISGVSASSATSSGIL
mmetsp:Transcript_78713/g.127645  ORF Transcript_78713/g.127645 Transcript_78713/m.127645 type:complete len:294 (-) Transcript_78713:1351-2232(-)